MGLGKYSFAPTSSGFPPNPDATMDALEAEMEEVKRRPAEEESRPFHSIHPHPRQLMIFSFAGERDCVRGTLESSSTTLLKSYCGIRKQFSKADLSSLRTGEHFLIFLQTYGCSQLRRYRHFSVYLKDMLLNNTHKVRLLHCFLMV